MFALLIVVKPSDITFSPLAITSGAKFTGYPTLAKYSVSSPPYTISYPSVRFYYFRAVESDLKVCVTITPVSVTLSNINSIGVFFGPHIVDL